MSVVIETTLGDITVDLFLSERPRACLNFVKLCKIKYYNYNLFHTISRGFIAQTGDPTGSRSGGESIFGVLDGPLKRYFEGEDEPRIKHTKMGLISFVGNEDRMIGSQFFLTLGDDLTYLDEKHCVFGEVVEGFDILEIINEVICDTDDRPYQDVRVTHTVILDDPYPNPKRLVIPTRSPSPSAERLQGGRIAPDEEVDEMEGKTAEEVAETQAEREAKARATILEMVGDLPDADMAPPENVLFVCKLNPVTNDDDLEIIFSRFGKIKSCEVIRDKKTGDSLQYAFVEFEDQKACEDAYFKMDNVLIDDRRIHVDFSQSVSKVKWHGKGRGVTHYDEKGNKTRNNSDDVGKGNYTHKRNQNYSRKNEPTRNKRSSAQVRERSGSPRNSRGNPAQSTSKRSNSPSPNRKRDFGSPKRIEKNRYLKEKENPSKKSRNRSLTPKMRSRSPSYREDRNNSRKSKEISRSPNRGQSGSVNYKDNREQRGARYRDKSRSPRRSSDKKDGTHSSKQKYATTSSKEVSSTARKRSYSPERKKVDRRERSALRDKVKLSTRKRSHSDSDDGTRTRRDKKKISKSSESSDSDSEKKVTAKKYYSDSSSSDNNKGRKFKKKSTKERTQESSSDSDSYKRKKYKKKKKHQSDSD